MCGTVALVLWAAIVFSCFMRQINSKGENTKVSIKVNVVRPTTLNPIADATFMFANALYAAAVASDNATDNVILSPANLHFILSLAYTGAKGETARQLANVLFVNNTPKVVAAGYRELIHVRGKVPLVIRTNRIYLDDRFKVHETFFFPSFNNFNSKAENINFRYPTAVVHTINNWANTWTSGKIEDVVAEDSFDTSTQMALVSSSYFKAQWAFPFDSRRTSVRPFHVTVGNTQDVVMMNVEKKIRMVENAEIGANVLQVAYREPLSLFVISPFDVAGLKTVEEKLRQTSLKNITSMANATVKIIGVFLPKFHLEARGSVKETLQALGLGDIFKTGADFSVMASGGPVVSDVLHKAVISMNEEGSEAKIGAAVDATNKTAKQVMPDQDDFVVDRPFIFLVICRKLGGVLYMGRYSKPTS